MTELAGLVARRLCHDFAGPIGAISTALDLLEEDSNSEILGLIRDSARGLSASLRLYRVVLSPGESAVANHEAQHLLVDWAATRNGITIDWQVASDQLEALRAATLLGMALIACETLTRGGKLVVADQFVETEGANLRIDREVQAALGGETTATTPRAALARLVLANAIADGQRIAMTIGPQTLRLHIHEHGGTVA